MEFLRHKMSRSNAWLILPLLMLAFTCAGHAQTCLTASDMDEATKSALSDTAQSYFAMVARGDAAALKQDSIAGLAANFSGIETAVRDNQSNLAGAKAAARPPFLLQAEGTAPLERAEFLCGVFGPNGQTAESAVLMIPNLPPGHYAFVALDVATTKGAYTFSVVLQQEGTAWKLGGLYIKPSQTAGHDGEWYAQPGARIQSQGAGTQRLVLLS